MTVTGTGTHPDRQASLSDGSTTIEFIFTDGQGGKDANAFRASPYPRTALKTTSGESKYSDLEPPYFAIAQDDFTGGRGNEDFESDTSRYFDGYRIDTTKETGVILGGRETYSTGIGFNVDQHLEDTTNPGSMRWEDLYGTEEYLSDSFVASASYTTYECEIWVKKVGSPGNLSVELWDDSGGSPNTMQASKSLSAASITTDVISLFKNFVWTGTPGVTASTTYWIVVHSAGSDSATNHWKIGCDNDGEGKKSADGSSWSTYVPPWYRITETKTDVTRKFFEYKSGLYFITQPESGGNSALYINGDRGAADSNSGNKGLLNDSSKSWTANEWTNARVIITKGPGSEELQPWRNITGNATNTLTVSPAWNVAHTTATEYVIVDTDIWTVIDADLDAYITDVEVSGDYIWLAKGGANGDTSIARLRYYNSGGTWTAEEEATSSNLIADKLLSVNHPNEGETLYSSTTAHEHNGISIYKGRVPKEAISADEYLFYPIHTFDTTVPWNDVSVTNVTQELDDGHTHINIAAGHTTGTAAVQNIDALDIRTGDTLVAEVYSNDTALAANDYQFVYDDIEDLGQERSPVKVFLESHANYDNPTIVFHWDDPDGTEVFTDQTRTYDGVAIDGDTITITSDDFIAIGYSEPFSSITVDIGTQGNDVADRTLTGYYFKGDSWSSGLGITDGTKVADNGTFRTFAQDGDITWTVPEGWQASTLNDVEAYWVLLTPDGDLTASINFNRFVINRVSNTILQPDYTDLTNTYDGDTITLSQLTLGTTDHLLIGHGTKFNEITVDVGTVSTENGVLTAQYYNGYDWGSVTIVDGTANTTPASNQYAFEKDGDITFTIPNNWEANTVNGTEAYWIRLTISVALTTKFTINEITVTRDNSITVNIPAVAQDTWTTVFCNLADPVAIPDESSIRSIGLNVAVDKGANDFFIRKMYLAKKRVDVASETAFRMPGNERINGLQAYAGNVDDPILNPWIFTTDAVYEMQTQNSDQIVRIPLEELSSLASPENGLAHCVNGTYIYFNIGERIERYFNRTLDDIGPDRDSGLPSNRPGLCRSLVSYPGRVYAAIDADTGQSSVLALDGSSWHEVYRAPRSGLNYRIRSIYAQGIPGTNVDRLWVCMGYDLVSLPICIDPYNETDYTFTHEGVLTTSYIHANLKDVVKLWKSLKIFAEDVTAAIYITADYQVDSDTTWTEIGTFDTDPVEEIDIASTLPQAKRIRYRLRFNSNSVTSTPRMKAIVTEGVAFVPVKYQYSWTFKVTQDVDNIDNFGVFDDTLTSLQQYNQLVSWANGGQPLTLRHHSSLYDNKTVFLNPASLSPIRIVNEGPQGSQEVHVASVTCIEA